MNDSHTLIPMGAGEPEAVRCRIPVFETPASFPVRSLRGTGPRGLVRDDRLVADADNRRAARAPRKRG